MRLIDADALYEKTANWEAQALHMVEVTMYDEDKTEWRKWSTVLTERSAFKHDIADAPTIDAVEVVHGEWIHGREIGKEWNCGYWITYFEDWHCSNCGVVFEQESKPKYHFCPNCGAKMDGERRDPCSSQDS